MLKGFVLCLGFVLVVGCGGDDEGDADSSDDESGTCDASLSEGECTEVTSHPSIVSGERDYCLESGGRWNSDPCPTGPNLVGCCHSSVAGEWLDCTYTGGIDNPEEACLALDGEWRPGSR